MAPFSARNNHALRSNDHLGRDIPFWDRSVNLVIATHPDEDHVAGLPGVFDRFEVIQLITNGQTGQEESYQH